VPKIYSAIRLVNFDRGAVPCSLRRGELRYIDVSLCETPQPLRYRSFSPKISRFSGAPLIHWARFAGYARGEKLLPVVGFFLIGAAAVQAGSGFSVYQGGTAVAPRSTPVAPSKGALLQFPASDI